MLKNILAAIGLLVVSRKGYDWYTEFQDLKKKSGPRRGGSQDDAGGGR